jgi:uncharacterized protein (TIGR02145 family)
MRNIIYSVLALLIGSVNITAQVTIGSDQPPRAGAGLDLRSSDKGLLLPNVALSDPATAFQLDGGASTTATGMVVYNTSAELDGPGVYVWDGSRWILITCVPETPGTIDLSPTTVNLNGTFTASVPEATGPAAPTAYAWALPTGLNGTSITRTITITGATAGPYAAGAIKVAAVNACGTSTERTSAMAVTVRDCSAAPTITAPTVDQTRSVAKTGTLALDVAASANGGTLSYSWETSNDGINNWNPVVSNGASAAYTVPTTTEGTYNYRCAVSNECGPTVSVKFTVTVHPCTAAPEITAAAQYSFEINKNVSQSLGVTADGKGSGSMTYQWKSSVSADGPWQNANGAGNTTTAYTVPTATAGTVCYKCEVTSSCGTTSSGVYTVTVRDCSAAPTVSSPASDQTPANQAVNAVYAMTVTANIYSASSVTYQWQSSTNGNDWENVSTGGNSNAYNAPTVAANLGTTYYRCRVTTTCGDAVSPKWKITVVECSAAPTISSPASDETKITKTGEAVSDLSVTAEGKGATPTYQWQSSANLSTWDPIESATGDTFTAPVTNAGTTHYRCVVTTGCGSATSKVFTVNVCGTAIQDDEENWYCTGNFGTAGTWMTMNLRSTTGLTANSNSGNSNLAYYYYPYSSQATFTSHPEYGLLYTWFAASGRTSTDNEGNRSHGPHQGICPSGWHLPSDMEWYQLEQVIAESAQGVHSSDEAITWDVSATVTGYRGTHAPKMKSRTAVDGQTTGGSSNGLAANGFDALLVGDMHSGSSGSYGTNASFWSSSSGSGTYAWCRALYSSSTGVPRGNGSKYNMFSVRCKKTDN